MQRYICIEAASILASRKWGLHCYMDTVLCSCTHLSKPMADLVCSVLLIRMITFASYAHKCSKWLNCPRSCIHDSTEACHLYIIWILYNALPPHLLLRPQVLYIERQLVALVHMSSRMFRLAVQVINRMRVKGACLLAVEDMAQARRVRQSENAVSSICQ